MSLRHASLSAYARHDVYSYYNNVQHNISYSHSDTTVVTEDDLFIHFIHCLINVARKIDSSDIMVIFDVVLLLRGTNYTKQ